MPCDASCEQATAHLLPELPEQFHSSVYSAADKCAGAGVSSRTARTKLNRDSN
jgi:hypothetical protein